MKSNGFGNMIDSLRTQLWPVPLVAVLVAIVLGQLLPFVDRQLEDDMPEMLAGLLFGGGPESARSLMETIAGSMITVTSLTFSLTVVTLQLASGQFSPRLLRTFSRDRFVHVTLAMFLSTFVFALTVLRSIRVETSDGDGFVPEISVTVGFVLTVASVVALVLFLAHLARQIRVETMLQTVHAESSSAIDRVFPIEPVGVHAVDALVQRPGGQQIESRKSGFLLSVNAHAADRAAIETEAILVVDEPPGASLVEGVPYARAWALDGGDLSDEQVEKITHLLAQTIAIGFERTSTHDVEFGFQQLLDVASRALSPGINDPTTAVHAVGHLSSLLCLLTSRQTGPHGISEDGRVQLVVRYPRFDELLGHVMSQLVHYGMDDPRTARRTIELLREVTWSDKEGQHVDVIRAELGRLETALDGAALSEHDRSGLHNAADAVRSAIARQWVVRPSQ